MGNDMTTPELPPLPAHPDDCIADVWSAHEERAIRAYAESARAPLVAEVEKLRELLAVVYSGPALYCDDGCLEDNRMRPCIDFRRDSADTIREKMQARAGREVKP